MSDGITESREGTYFIDRSSVLANIVKPQIVWFTGLPQSGKSTVAMELGKLFHDWSKKYYILDGDVFREGLNKDLGFSPEDRAENLRRAAEVAKLIYDLGYSIFAAFISPTDKDRKMIKEILPEVKFVYIDTELSVCEQRDTRGMYKLAREGKIKDFTGVDAPYEIPSDQWLTIDTHLCDLKTNIDVIVNRLKSEI